MNSIMVMLLPTSIGRYREYRNSERCKCIGFCTGQTVRTVLFDYDEKRLRLVQAGVSHSLLTCS